MASYHTTEEGAVSPEQTADRLYFFLSSCRYEESSVQGHREEVDHPAATSCQTRRHRITADCGSLTRRPLYPEDRVWIICDYRSCSVTLYIVNLSQRLLIISQRGVREPRVVHTLYFLNRDPKSLPFRWPPWDLYQKNMSGSQPRETSTVFWSWFIFALKKSHSLS